MNQQPAKDVNWSALIELNRVVDGLIGRCRKAIEPTQPISREIPFYTSIEARFDNLPTSLATITSAPVSSDAREGNNVKQTIFTNFGSRVYVRELGFQVYTCSSGNTRDEDSTGRYPANWRWNFLTSITQRKYSPKNVLASSGGRWSTGSHLAFREPLVIEPMETFIYDCELLNGPLATARPSTIIAMYLSGYREGI